MLEGKYHGHIPGPRHHTALDAFAKLLTPLVVKEVAIDLLEVGEELVSDDLCVDVDGTSVGRGPMELPLEALVESHSFEPGEERKEEDLWVALVIGINLNNPFLLH